MEQERFGHDDAKAAADLIADKLDKHSFNHFAVNDGLILGSGLSHFVRNFMEGGKMNEPSGPIGIPFTEIWEALKIPPMPTLVGHPRKLVIGPLKDTDQEHLVIAQAGREHPFEGASMQRATFWLRVMQIFRVERLIASNASGIITPHTLKPQSMGLVMEHIDEGMYGAGINPLVGHEDERLGPRHPDQLDLYPAETRATIKKVATELGIDLPEVAYARRFGPSYEPPGEIYRLRAAVQNTWEEGRKQPGETRFTGEPKGVVGMSSTYEAMVMAHARQANASNSSHGHAYPGFERGSALISAITNYAGSCGPNGFVQPDNDAHVKETAAKMESQFGQLVNDSLLRLREA